MAVLLPAATPLIYPAAGRRGRPILSGEVLDDRPHGWQGYSAAQNCLYARRVQALASHSDLNGLARTTAPGFTTALYYALWVSADVTRLEVYCYLEDGAFRAQIGAVTADSASALGSRIESVTIAAAGGAEHTLTIMLHRHTTECILRSVLIRERRLDAAEIP
jgi:hypothetical protein